MPPVARVIVPLIALIALTGCATSATSGPSESPGGAGDVQPEPEAGGARTEFECEPALAASGAAEVFAQVPLHGSTDDPERTGLVLATEGATSRHYCAWEWGTSDIANDNVLIVSLVVYKSPGAAEAALLSEQDRWSIDTDIAEVSDLEPPLTGILAQWPDLTPLTRSAQVIGLADSSLISVKVSAESEVASAEALQGIALAAAQYLAD
jgi:hypothetical protein